MFKSFVLNKLHENIDNLLVKKVTDLLTEGNSYKDTLAYSDHTKQLAKMENGFLSQLANKYPLYYKKPSADKGYWYMLTYDDKKNRMIGIPKDKIKSDDGDWKYVQPNEENAPRFSFSPADLVYLCSLPENEWIKDEFNKKYKIEIDSLKGYYSLLDKNKENAKNKQSEKLIAVYKNEDLLDLISKFDSKYKHKESTLPENSNVLRIAPELGKDDIERVSTPIEQELFMAYYVDHITNKDDLERMFKKYFKKEEPKLNNSSIKTQSLLKRFGGI